MTLDIDPLSMLQPCIAAATDAIPTSWPDGIGIFLFCLVFFLLLNAFFVASEFAIVKVRPSQIDVYGEKRPRRAKQSRRVVDNLDAYLSANQLGITLASLGLTIFAEPYLHKVLLYLLAYKCVVTFEISWLASEAGKSFISWFSKFGALAFFTIFHVVIGELVPKAIAIRKPLAVTAALSQSLHWFYVLFYPLIRVLNGLANLILKYCFRMEPMKEGEHVHSSEELALLVTESGENQEVTDTERQILMNALELNDVSVYDVMTPRNDVVTLDINDSFEKLLEIALETKHTRFPVVDGHLDKSLGLIHIKDIIKLVNRENPDLQVIMRDLKEVPETMPLDVLLKFFQREKEHLALVVDEFGSTAGLVFLDNVLEELVGDIQDEFDTDEGEFIRLSEGEFLVQGSMPLNELSDYVPEIKIESGEVSTIGGVVTQQLQRLPHKGDQINLNGYRVRVLSTENRKVGKLKFKKLTLAQTQPLEAAESLSA